MNRKKLACLCAAVALHFPVVFSVASAQSNADLPYRNPQLSATERAHDLLNRMTLEEKFWQLFMTPGDLSEGSTDYANGIFGLQIRPNFPDSGAVKFGRAHAEHINNIQRFFVEETRLGIPIIPFEETLHGLAQPGATAFPQAIALAATWDTMLVERVAQAIARETRSRGIRQVLSPVINIANDVRWGRVEETYGEDVYLSCRMGVAFITEFERAGIVTTPKHFVANVGQGGRDSYPIEFSERLLEEYFFPPFLAAIEHGGARSVMTSYNSVDGSPATQNRWLLTDKLKGDWGFTGFVISDAAATGGATVLHFTEPNTPTAAKHAWEAGLDVVFQTSVEQHRPYWGALRMGMVDEAIIDVAVERVLRAKFELGLFEEPYVDPDSAAHWNGYADHRLLARDAARASMVLLKNELDRLPLDKSLKSIAVIGADAVEGRLGGYSGPGIEVVSILDGLKAAVSPATEVVFAAGPGRVTPDFTVVPAEYLTFTVDESVDEGLRGEYFDNIALEGSPRLVRTDRQVDFRWTLSSPGEDIPVDWYSVRWTGKITVPADGVRRIGVEGNDGYRLFLDGRSVVDSWSKESYRAQLADVTLEPGTSYDLRLEFFETTGNARVRLVWDAGTDHDGWRANIDSAVAAARGSDAAIIVAGIEEGEFRDRAYLALPGHQEELIRAVSATGTPVVVVLVGGSAITMSSWIDDVDAALFAWYPGEVGGHAVSDVLFGEYNPAGRLPITFPLAEGQLPLTYNHKPTGRGDDYLDLSGLPLFPFGFGLSYTTFEYSALSIEPALVTAEDSVLVRFLVKNVGSREGDEVVQLYIRDLLASVARPVMELRGFQRLRLAPGEEREVTFVLTSEHLRMFNAEKRWVVEPGAFRILVGASSRDIRLRGTLEVGVTQ